MTWYTIHCDGPHGTSSLAMHFRDRETALLNASHLLAAGFPVRKVEGPSFRMGRMALLAFDKKRRSASTQSTAEL